MLCTSKDQSSGTSRKTAGPLQTGYLFMITNFEELWFDFVVHTGTLKRRIYISPSGSICGGSIVGFEVNVHYVAWKHGFNQHC